MEALIATRIDEVLLPLGFEKTTQQNTNVVNGGDDVGQIEVHFLFYRLRNSDYYLEIHLTIYKGRTTDTSKVAVNLLISHPRIDYRIFGAFKFVDDESTMRDNITDMLKIPADKLINATNPAAKCFGHELIREKILNHLQSRNVAQLEQVSTCFRSELFEPSVDRTFWRKHYEAQYGTNDLNGQQTYRTQYHRRKLQQRDWLRFANRYPPIIHAFIPCRRPHQPEPDPMAPFDPSPRRPSRPNPNIPDPRRPILPAPFNPNRPQPQPYNPFGPPFGPQPQPYNPLQPANPGGGGPFPPLLGDFNQPNRIPGDHPIGDPSNTIPGNIGRPQPGPGGSRGGGSGFFGGGGGGGFV